MTDERRSYLKLLAEKYPSERALTREIINLNAILNLPKGTEHFMSDLHGEYEAFCHILNNCSGVVREKIEQIFGESLSHSEIKELCTLIYYPKEKLRRLKRAGSLDLAWYRTTLEHMLEAARMLSSKYTRSKVRKAMPEDYAYIIDELLHAQKDEDNNQVHYHSAILDTIIGIDADDFVISLAELIKRLAVDHLHIVGHGVVAGLCLPCDERDGLLHGFVHLIVHGAHPSQLALGVEHQVGPVQVDIEQAVVNGVGHSVLSAHHAGEPQGLVGR